MTGYQRRQRTTFSRDQLMHLQRVFKANHYPDAEIRSRLAHITKLDPARIQVWFQNQRAKDRKRQDVRQQDSRSPSPSPQSFTASIQNEALQVIKDEEEARNNKQNLLTSQNFVYVFNSTTANEAAEAISEGKFNSLAEFHRNKYGWPPANCHHHHHHHHHQPQHQQFHHQQQEH